MTADSLNPIRYLLVGAKLLSKATGGLLRGQALPLLVKLMLFYRFQLWGFIAEGRGGLAVPNLIMKTAHTLSFYFTFASGPINRVCLGHVIIKEASGREFWNLNQITSFEN